MARAPSQPERSAEQLISRLNLALERNEPPGALKLDLRWDGRGTSVIRDGSLYRDAPPPVGPKNFKRIEPDYFGASFFVEVKGDVSGNSWEGLSRDACNDNIRLALLRMARGAIDDPRVEYGGLDASLQRLVDNALAPYPRSLPEGRVYLRWEDLKSVVSSPSQNCQRTDIDLSGRTLPIKAVVGGPEALYILDAETMTEWRSMVR
ncbi:hypothetical protein OM076_03935 [Solirubrobacter ginsenosidimutans]|uniref:Uncharacterized protein n=1 Tax=Solirubrobacter ginsenosidimutans TaxID=490573 RepID=A0A9X3S3E0_9ACTN|nr:hypothetical protein [Solirubrobacter ginsenosidimutans]MDA0159403.1 hypothetical protein [Solirubrobacter ginsenosidimutans]